jgi:cystathionine beta-lyase/cystathionine gamma-synthase
MLYLFFQGEIMPKEKLDFSTLTVSAGEEEKLPLLGAVAKPIFQTSTFAFKNIAEMKKYLAGDKSKYFYTRYANPTLAAVEEKMAKLEGGEKGLVLSSGMAAISTAIFALVNSGDEIISTYPLYGGTNNLFAKLLPGLNIKVHFVFAEQIEKAEKLVNSKIKILYCETPTNPNLKLVDLKKAHLIAKKHKLTLVVDSTFATPYNLKPISYGTDLVVHSATKYLGGHSDLVAGVLVGKEKIIDQTVQVMKILGGCLDPLGGFLLLRGLKTLAIRVPKQNENGRKVAEFMSKHPKVKRVFYPGLKTHPQYNLAKSQMKGFGGMVCFELKGGEKDAIKLVDNLKVFLNAVSLGGVESLASLPIYSSHYGQSPEELKRNDVTSGMVRLSCGIEDANDLVEDLKQALGKLR